MADWPTAVDFAEWTGAHSSNASDPTVGEAVAAANHHIKERCVVFVRDDDGDGVPDPVRLAALMLAARWHRRKDTPGGVASFGGDAAAGVIRHDIVDRDVENLIAPWTPYPIGCA